jgi:hypothetical protein
MDFCQEALVAKPSTAQTPKSLTPTIESTFSIRCGSSPRERSYFSTRLSGRVN